MASFKISGKLLSDQHMEEIGSLTISEAITQGRNSSSRCHLIDIRTVLDLMSIPRERERVGRQTIS